MSNRLGHIYLRPHGKVYWIKYYKDGKPYYESSGSTMRTVARDLLKTRITSPVPVTSGKIKIGELLDDYEAYAKVHNAKSYETFGKVLAKKLREFWGTGRHRRSPLGPLTITSRSGSRNRNKTGAGRSRMGRSTASWPS